jgi:hypothetical protein
VYHVCSGFTLSSSLLLMRSSSVGISAADLALDAAAPFAKWQSKLGKRAAGLLTGRCASLLLSAVPASVYLRLLLSLDPFDGAAFARASATPDCATVFGTRADAMYGHTAPSPGVAAVLFTSASLTVNRLYRCTLVQTFLRIISISPLRSIRLDTCKASGMTDHQAHSFLHFCVAACMDPILLLVGFPSDFQKDASLGVSLASRPHCAPFASALPSSPAPDIRAPSDLTRVLSGADALVADTFCGPLIVTKVRTLFTHPHHAGQYQYVFVCTLPSDDGGADRPIPVSFGFDDTTFVASPQEIIVCGLHGSELVSGAVPWVWPTGTSRTYGSSSTQFRFRPVFVEPISSGGVSGGHRFYGSLDIVLRAAPFDGLLCCSHLLSLGAVFVALGVPGVSFWGDDCTDARKRLPGAVSYLTSFLRGDAASSVLLASSCAVLGLTHWSLPPTPADARRAVAGLWARQQ